MSSVKGFIIGVIFTVLVFANVVLLGTVVNQNNTFKNVSTVVNNHNQRIVQIETILNKALQESQKPVVKEEVKKPIENKETFVPFVPKK